MDDVLRHDPLAPRGWRRWICRLIGHREELYQLTWSQRTGVEDWLNKKGGVYRGCSRCGMLEELELKVPEGEVVFLADIRTERISD